MSIIQKLGIGKTKAGREGSPEDTPDRGRMFIRNLREKTTMRMRERTITAISRTSDGIEWTSCRVKPDGVEQLSQDTATVAFSGESADEILASIELPEHVSEDLSGDITVSLRTSELLMRVMEFPTVDEDEIADMVGFQIDKFSPFPQEQLAVSHEVLQRAEASSLVLLIAAKRECIDTIGDTFNAKGVRIHGIDARVLGWLKLLKDEGHVSGDGCELIIIDDDIDTTLIVIADGMPVAIRLIDAAVANGTTLDELTEEIGYTLTTLETEFDLPEPTGIQFWSHTDLVQSLRMQWAERSGLEIVSHQLAELPPLSEGIVRRTLSAESRIELVPREWIEYERRRKLRRQFTLIASSITAVWLVVLFSFYITFKVREGALHRSEERLAAIEPDARQALENRHKLKLLKVYTDRTHSALECLREVTALLPPEDVEFASYNYKKGKGVTLRGSAQNDDAVYEFFNALAKSELFERVRDQSVNARSVKGVRSSVFLVTLDLPVEEEIK